MRFIQKYILRICLIGAVMFSACSSDAPEVVSPDNGETVESRNTPRITLTINPVYMGYTSTDVIEMIGNLRIIMVSEIMKEDGESESFVEINEFIDFKNGNTFTGPGEVATRFRYVFTRSTVAGKKKFFLIANENIVGKVNFQLEAGEAAPDWIASASDLNLSGFLNHYKPDYVPGLSEGKEETSPHGEEFVTLINSLYYTPTFQQVPQGESVQGPVQDAQPDNSTQNKEIYLPYISYYEYELASQEDIDNDVAGEEAKVNVLNETMYLVPCATKFSFKFKNFREDPVFIPSMKISGVAKSMYLFPKFNSEDALYYDFGDQKNMWWVNWLAAISQASHLPSNFPDPNDNEAFNTSFGWISDYSVPDTAYDSTPDETINKEERFGVVELVPEGSIWYVENRAPGSSPITGPPGEASTGYFYLPESRWLVTRDVENPDGSYGTEEMQGYYLTITMDSGPDATVRAEKDTDIGRLASMFRNTNILITISMKDSKDVGAFADIIDWDVKHVAGNVTEITIPEEELNGQ